MIVNYTLLLHYCQPWDCLLHEHLKNCLFYALRATGHNLIWSILLRNNDTDQRVSFAVPLSSIYLIWWAEQDLHLHSPNYEFDALLFKLPALIYSIALGLVIVKKLL